jgi:hypothetical protein
VPHRETYNCHRGPSPQAASQCIHECEKRTRRGTTRAKQQEYFSSAGTRHTVLIIDQVKRDCRLRAHSTRHPTRERYHLRTCMPRRSRASLKLSSAAWRSCSASLGGARPGEDRQTTRRVTHLSLTVRRGGRRAQLNAHAHRVVCAWMCECAPCVSLMVAACRTRSGSSTTSIHSSNLEDHPGRPEAGERGQGRGRSVCCVMCAV